MSVVLLWHLSVCTGDNMAMLLNHDPSWIAFLWFVCLSLGQQRCVSSWRRAGLWGGELVPH